MNATPAQRIEELSRRLPGGVTLVAVSKFHPVEAILSAYSAGQRMFELKQQKRKEKHRGR